MKFADLRSKSKVKNCQKVNRGSSSSGSGGSSPGLDCDNSLMEEMMDHNSSGKGLICIFSSQFILKLTTF